MILMMLIIKCSFLREQSRRNLVPQRLKNLLIPFLHFDKSVKRLDQQKEPFDIYY